MALLGMDVEAVRNLATQMEAAADEIQTQVTALKGGVEGVDWKGTDHDTFVTEWQAQEANLTTLVTGIKDAAGKARTNADAQDQTSGDY